MFEHVELPPPVSVKSVLTLRTSPGFSPDRKVAEGVNVQFVVVEVKLTLSEVAAPFLKIVIKPVVVVPFRLMVPEILVMLAGISDQVGELELLAVILL